MRAGTGRVWNLDGCAGHGSFYVFSFLELLSFPGYRERLNKMLFRIGSDFLGLQGQEPMSDMSDVS